VNLRWQVVVGKTSPFPMGQVFSMVKPSATVQFQVDPETKLYLGIGTIANTSHEVTILFSASEVL
jgi:hypothetical protein